ncbi:MAG: hypothetical protein IH621_15550 [Krumholzibacteria bacterium]|nr:hypothetical protein [Candidatus Krumholzibacteria bacterium]
MAREILRRPGGRLQAVLPLPAEEYARDFPTEESRREFAALLGAAEETFTVADQATRGEAYRLVGREVVDRCDLLIAIWDGDPARGKGGTAETVAYARSRNKPIYLIDGESPTRITREGFVADRDSTGGEGLATGPAPRPPSAPLDGLNNLGDLDRALEECKGSGAGEDEEGAGRALTRRLQQVIAHFGPAYHEAGARAERAQNTYRQTSKAVYILATLAVLIVAAQSIFGLSHWIIAGEFGAIAVILLMTKLGNRRGWHMLWLENRLEAEWLRHGIFVAFLSGQTTPGIDRHWACRWVARSDGVAKVKQVWNELPHLGAPPEAGLGILKAFMRSAWLEEQRDYHARKAAHEVAKHHRIERAGELAFWLTFVAAALHLVPHSIYHHFHLPDKPIIRVLTILAIGLPALGAALTGLRAHFEYRKIAARSAMMAEHLEILIGDLAGVRTVTQLGELVKETETLMLQENSDWYFTIGLHELEKG